MILHARAKSGSANVSALEAEIDQLVYSLYGLTSDEIRIVEEAASDVGAGERGARNPDDEQVAGVTDGD